MSDPELSERSPELAHNPDSDLHLRLRPGGWVEVVWWFQGRRYEGTLKDTTPEGDR